ncbi:putative HD/PDEase domain, 3'5'-cyclic nucleotide phosphodiesterase, GAF-like domain superfamily [Plasmopara halstedii]
MNPARDKDMGHVFSNCRSNTTTTALHHPPSLPPVQISPGRQHSLSGRTVSSSQDSDADNEKFERILGRRRRRNSFESSASSNLTHETTGISSHGETDRRLALTASSMSSFVNRLVAWFMSCAGTVSRSEDFSDYDGRYLVDQKHRLFWELVQRILELNDVVLMIRLLLDFLLDDLGAAAAAVFLVDQNSQNMSRITRGAPTQSGMAPSRGLVGQALKSRVARSLADFSLEEGYDPQIDLAQEFSGQKLFSVPLVEHDSVYAIIEATNVYPTQRPMEDLYLKLLTWLGPILSSCMRKCIEYHDVLLSERTQKAFLHIISSSDTKDTVLNLVDGVIDGACHITNAERVTLFMIDWETDELWSLSSSYNDETLRVPLQASMLGLAATTQQTLNVRNPKFDRRYNWRIDERRGIHTRCVLYVPVGIQESSQSIEKLSNRPIAVLEIINKVEERVSAGASTSCCQGFTFDDECALEAFACEVAVILRRRCSEIEYIKLLADTRAEQVLAKRARSQVNLLECYTSYASATRAHPEACLRNAFVPSDRHVAGCLECAATAEREKMPAETASGNSIVDPNDHTETIKQCVDNIIGSKNVNSGRLGYEFVGSDANIPSRLSFSAPPGSRFPSLDFNVFSMNPAALPKLLEEMYLDFKVDEVLKTTKHRLQNFIVAMKEHYHPNPFHNFLHAFSVVHASYLLLSTTDAGQLLQPIDIAACLVASLGHDVDHPGHTNDFEVKSGSQLAMLYSDESVLEHHHAYTTFRLISKEKNANILQDLSPVDYSYVRKVIITAILGTDMANHFKFLESLEKLLRPTSHLVDTMTISSAKRDIASVSAIIRAGSEVDEEKQGPVILNVLRDAVMLPEGAVAITPSGSTMNSIINTYHSTTGSKHCPGRATSGRLTTGGWVFNGTVDERLFLVKTIVHASDLSGQVFPKPVALKWSNMISKEFAYQALMEQTENIPISYRNIDDPLKMVEGQLFFAQKIVSPFWDLMFIMFPDLKKCMSNLRTNVAHYEQELQRLKDARSEEGQSEDRLHYKRNKIQRQFDHGSEDEQLNNRLRRDSMCGCVDEGVAVPGLAKHNPAKFNSFRTIHEADDNSSSDFEEVLSNGEPCVRASAVAAAEKSGQAKRLRSCSIGSSDSSDLEIDEQSLVVYE